MTPQPLVSCITPTYNRGRFLASALEYFARQDYPNRELIIIDDGSEPPPAYAEDVPAVRPCADAGVPVHVSCAP